MIRRFLIIVIMLGITVLIPAHAASQLETVEISGARLSNTSGASLGDHINIGQQAQISANIKNNLDQSQEFVYIYQVKDEAGFVIELAWITGLLSPDQSFNTGLSWNPDTGGAYTVEIFVWDSLIDRNALDNFETFEVIVS
ncbi:MAG: hypothetical protein GWN01_14960 [Nitrosopumilaceae archaeon]|nr:hypothetical protein [Nitrosopumilaceae archaeon]NIU02149.1 hypothetical protein [Nitrosopumilaceae archaeon]NIU88538.1 hypothetical protein [Nitrosopumilaceae archaeon]NIV66772.1 hypothetical protein [Nitrosopumilaceae archaeon]NIX62750.1 hypothetical protein [Nitrosopumilaceae archaeon]